MSAILFASSCKCLLSGALFINLLFIDNLIVFLTGLYTKGLIFIDVPIADDDYIVGKNKM